MGIVQRDYKLRALSEVWTGNANRKNDKLVLTGLMGSIRWWFEVLVRGMDGYACDPTETQCKDDKHCVVCELFGCTGWARKFRFEVLDEKGDLKITKISSGNSFIFRFIELRPISPEEWTLLDATLRLIAEYGAIGGKTVLKPSNENNRDQHKDYGLIKIDKVPSFEKRIVQQLKEYSSSEKFKCLKKEDKDFRWAALKNFWCVKGESLSRQDSNKSTFNAVIGRREPKSQSKNIDTNDRDINQWLAGKQQESKKVFSFKNPARTFGFVKPGLIDFAEMKKRLTAVWPDLKFIEGSAVINELFGKEKNQ